MTTIRILCCTVILSTFGCSSSSSTNKIVIGDGGTTTDQKSCDDFALANCAKRQSCTNLIQGVGAQILQIYGDATTCQERERARCLNAVHAEGTGFTPIQAEKCAAAHANWNCADFLDNIPPADCAPLGTLTNGQACAFNGQCSSGFCSDIRKASCGVCAAAPAAGDSCETSFCGHDQICVDPSLTCQVRGALNAICDVATAPCEAGLTCTGTGTAAKTCQAASTTPGASCGDGSPGCYFAEGLWCQGAAQLKTCTRINYVAAGQACGTLVDGSMAVCRAGTCFTSAGPAAVTELGTCQANAGDGESCDTRLGPACITPAHCVTQDGGTNGTCVFPNSTSCG
jgi:hypothetical protein